MNTCIDTNNSKDFSHPDNLLQIDDDVLLTSERITILTMIFHCCINKFIFINIDKTRFLVICHRTTKECLLATNKEILPVDRKDGYKLSRVLPFSRFYSRKFDFIQVQKEESSMLGSK